MPPLAARTPPLVHRHGPADAPVVVVLGGISAPRDPCVWWPSVVGDGCAIDTAAFAVVGVEFLDGGAGPDGRPQRVVHTHDQAAAIAVALDALGVTRVHALVGASYGGMVALAFAERYPDRLDRLIAISAPAEPHPMATAWRSLQRRIVHLGLDTGRPHAAMAIARGLAMTSYRSTAEFGRRFRLAAGEHGAGVESYIEHKGEQFARSISPARFLALSQSADLHRVTPAAIRTPAQLVAARGDALVPFEQMLSLATHWGGPCHLAETPTQTGHDAFLVEPAHVAALVHDALTSPALA